ncbi:sugar glycosyltransferase [Erwinia sorbitola]|uniref:Sugar glycosyltransferase n=1 Tax=Erwinia sorbitola TaxID=2681984 RepID=A0A6I6ET64_9GAMM|nr:sugar glycosyltransferase [Erwinia sorbitola]QGU89466.1 sugar glycosyltransferase [Erwinia sorbitola]
MGTFFKQIYRYSHSRRFRHNENLWPYVKIKRASEGHISSLSVRGQPVAIVNLSDIARKYSGDLLLIASGPSVNETDFSPLQHLPAMGVNGSWFMHDKTNFKFFVIVDMTFIDQRQSMVKEMINDPDILFFTTVRGVVKVIEYFGYSAIRCQIAIVEDACFKSFQPQVLTEEIHQSYQDEESVSFCKTDRNIAFFKDIRKGVFDAGTVAHWALQIIQFMGFSRVIIAGLDMNNFQQPRFYENENDKSPCGLEQQFSGLIEPAFRHASQVLKENSIEVLNLSLNSALDSSIFKKVKPHDVC